LKQTDFQQIAISTEMFCHFFHILSIIFSYFCQQIVISQCQE